MKTAEQQVERLCERYTELINMASLKSKKHEAKRWMDLYRLVIAIRSFQLAGTKISGKYEHLFVDRDDDKFFDNVLNSIGTIGDEKIF